MNAPTYHYDATGERIEDDDTLAPASTPRTAAEIRQHCAELRKILREAREQRPTDER